MKLTKKINLILLSAGLALSLNALADNSCSQLDTGYYDGHFSTKIYGVFNEMNISFKANIVQITPFLPHTTTQKTITTKSCQAGAWNISLNDGSVVSGTIADSGNLTKLKGTLAPNEGTFPNGATITGGTLTHQ
jgi:hypothetical protein